MKTNMDQVHDLVDEWCESRNAGDFESLSDLPLAMLRRELHGGVDRSLSDELLDEATLGVDSVAARYALVGVPSPKTMEQAGPVFDRYMQRGFFHKMWGGFEHGRDFSFQPDGGLIKPSEWNFVLAENHNGGRNLDSELRTRDGVDRDGDAMEEYRQYVRMLPEGIEPMDLMTYIALMRVRYHAGEDHDPLDRGYAPTRANNVGVVRGADGEVYGVQTYVDSIGTFFVPSQATTTVKSLNKLEWDQARRYRAQVPFANVKSNKF